MSQQHLATLPNSDWHLDKLYDFLPSLGVTVMQANYNRYVVDLNREAKEPISGNFWFSPIPLQTAFGQPIYTTDPELETLNQRIDKFYLPYHAQLRQLIDEKIKEFGKVYLFDLHSFGGLINDQVCLGNQNGKSCSDKFISCVEDSFISQRYQVVKNKVFNGGYITKYYSKIPNVEVLQIEVRYQVYLDESQIDKPFLPDWNAHKFHLAKIKFQRVFAAIVSQRRVR